MFGDYVFEKSSAQYLSRILLLDDEQLNSKTNYISTFEERGFEIIRYSNDLRFRIEYEELLKSDKKISVVANPDQYIPYDIYSKFSVYKVTYDNLFPKLNAVALKDIDQAGLDLLSIAYPQNFDDLRQKNDTEIFLQIKVYERKNVKAYIKNILDELIKKARHITQFKDWFSIADEKAKLDVMSVQYDINIDTQVINRLFQEYALEHFGKFSQSIDKHTPVMISKAMDYMHSNSEKFVVIVMDGMSEFDWKIISTSFSNIQFEKTSMFAMIPSTTSVSRQCLLSGKYPTQLEEPWKQSKEKYEFIEAAKELGFTETQIGYERGYDARFGSFVKCGAVIINDVDDLVHSQLQGRLGMFNDITVLANQKKLYELTKRLTSNGFDVYITADHGNTPCDGLGKLIGTGVEVETKSRRMLALKDFANKDKLIERYNLIEYPKYYLPKEYDYLFCDIGESLDSKGADVMTHGGITLDEVVVPFIKIKAV